MVRLRGLTLFSELESLAVVGLIVFMPVESQRFMLRAASEKLHVCYLSNLRKEGLCTSRHVVSLPAAWQLGDKKVYGASLIV